VTAASVTIRIYPHTTVIVLRGDIGETNTNRLRQALVETLVRRRPRRIVVDLTDATVLDPTAIGALLAVQDSASDLHIALDVRRPNAVVTADLTGHGLSIIRAG
jgi:anti-anti-sigma factor